MQVAERMGSNLVGAITVLMVGLADSLGIFKHMAGQAPQTAATVAAASGLHERWVRELLHQLVRARPPPPHSVTKCMSSMHDGATRPHFGGDKF